MVRDAGSTIKMKRREMDSVMSATRSHVWCVFFFQAEDGIRDIGVTGVQTCALPISGPDGRRREPDDLVVLPDRVPGVDRRDRHLVAAGHRGADRKAAGGHALL